MFSPDLFIFLPSLHSFFSVNQSFLSSETSVKKKGLAGNPGEEAEKEGRSHGLHEKDERTRRRVGEEVASGGGERVEGVGKRD